MASARLSDRELANINAAAVTKEYRIKPHLGALSMLLTAIQASRHLMLLQTIERYLPSMGEQAICLAALRCLCWPPSNQPSGSVGQRKGTASLYLCIPQMSDSWVIFSQVRFV